MFLKFQMLSVELITTTSAKNIYYRIPFSVLVNVLKSVIKAIEWIN